ncbi:hypothetical protein [Marinospirillum minutulum]|uniref:hypothetical protein n=1 Tax=Marinospirillum minutulum TaxID=64974 RepID=UPI0004108D7B|nr:hypothetical protein [Marinospirillum minutulum]
MQTLLLRANEQVIQKLMSSINKLAKEGNDIEILDNLVYEKEKKLVAIALEQVEKGEVFSHEEVWKELLQAY